MRWRRRHRGAARSGGAELLAPKPPTVRARSRRRKGASAGGLEAFSKAPSTCADLDWRSAGSASRATARELSSRLARERVDLDGSQVTKGVRSSRIWVRDSAERARASGRRAAASPPRLRRSQFPPLIDFFFRSLAESSQERALRGRAVRNGVRWCRRNREVKAAAEHDRAASESAKYRRPCARSVATGMVGLRASGADSRSLPSWR